MRIISREKDYYDFVVPVDHSGKVWIRKSYFIELPVGTPRHHLGRFGYIYDKKVVSEKLTSMSDDDSVKCPLSYDEQSFLGTLASEKPSIFDNVKANARDFSFILGLCGRLYFIAVKCDPSYSATDYIIKSYFDFNEYLDQYKGKEKSFFYNRGLAYDEWKSIYTHHKDLDNIFIKLNTPLFIISKRHQNESTSVHGQLLITNPILSYYRLQSIFNPFDIYQEIDRYINNELTVHENCDINMTDALKIHAHGMDTKWSFRQQGPKPRKVKS